MCIRDRSKTGVAVFDKTGTLTKGVFKVTHTAPVDGVSEKDLLESAALEMCIRDRYKTMIPQPYYRGNVIFYGN